MRPHRAVRRRQAEHLGERPEAGHGPDGAPGAGAAHDGVDADVGGGLPRGMADGLRDALRAPPGSSPAAPGRAGRPTARSWPRCSARSAMRAMVRTTSAGSWPMAVSAESMTASVPSNTALATSETSARVGVGAVIMLSSIWVAVITGIPGRHARADDRLLQVGHVLQGHEMPEVTPGHHHGVGPLQDGRRGWRRPTAVSIFATSAGRRVRSTARTSSRSARRADERHRQVVDVDPAQARPPAARSSSVGQVTRTRSDGRCTPGRPWARPPVSRRGRTTPSRSTSATVERDGAVTEHDPVAPPHILQQARVLDLTSSPVDGPSPATRRSVCAFGEERPTVRERTRAHLRAGQVGQHGHGPPGSGGALPDDRRRAEVTRPGRRG